MSAPANWADDFFGGLWLDAQRQMWSDEESDHQAEACAHLLDLPEGAAILDVPCGDGRIAVRLAANGYEVTGVDRSEALLASARDLAEAAGVALKLEAQDMRALTTKSRYDGAVCMWGSIGYGSEDEDRAFLAAVARALRPGGALVLDTLVLETLLPNFTETSLHRAGDIEVVDHRHFDPATSRVESQWLLTRGEQVERRRSSIRIYSYRELCKMFRDSGFPSIDAFGSPELDPFEVGSPRLFVRAATSA